jgi:hypothetical protein
MKRFSIVLLFAAAGVASASAHPRITRRGARGLTIAQASRPPATAAIWKA